MSSSNNYNINNNNNNLFMVANHHSHHQHHHSHQQQHHHSWQPLSTQSISFVKEIYNISTSSSTTGDDNNNNNNNLVQQVLQKIRTSEDPTFIHPEGRDSLLHIQSLVTAPECAYWYLRCWSWFATPLVGQELCAISPVRDMLITIAKRFKHSNDCARMTCIAINNVCCFEKSKYLFSQQRSVCDAFVEMSEVASSSSSVADVFCRAITQICGDDTGKSLFATPEVSRALTNIAKRLFLTSSSSSSNDSGGGGGNNNTPAVKNLDSSLSFWSEAVSTIVDRSFFPTPIIHELFASPSLWTVIVSIAQQHNKFHDFLDGLRPVFEKSLLFAVQRGAVDVVRSFLLRGPPFTPNMTLISSLAGYSSSRGGKLIHEAAVSSSPSSVEVLIMLIDEFHANVVDINEDGEHPLHCACFVGNANNVRVLLSSRGGGGTTAAVASLSHRNIRGETPRDIAVRCKNTACVATIDEFLKNPTTFSSTSSSSATYSPTTTTTTTASTSDSNKSQVHPASSTTSPAPPQYYNNTNNNNNNNNSSSSGSASATFPIPAATSSSSASPITSLLSFGINNNNTSSNSYNNNNNNNNNLLLKNNNNNNNNAGGSGHGEEIRNLYLTNDGADEIDEINLTEEEIKASKELLGLATGGAVARVRDYLERRGAHIHYRHTQTSKQAIHNCVGGGNLRILELLLTHGASLSARTRDGFTARDLAVKLNRRAVVEFIDEWLQTKHYKNSNISTSNNNMNNSKNSSAFFFSSTPVFTTPPPTSSSFLTSNNNNNIIGNAAAATSSTSSSYAMPPQQQQQPQQQVLPAFGGLNKNNNPQQQTPETVLINSLYEQTNMLRSEMATLRTENAMLKKQNAGLRSQVRDLMMKTSSSSDEKKNDNATSGTTTSTTTSGSNVADYSSSSEDEIPMAK